MKNKQNKTLNLNLQKFTSCLQGRKELVNHLKDRGYKIRTCTHTHTHTHTHIHTHTNTPQTSFITPNSLKLGCSTQNFIFKHLGTKQQPHTCPRRHEMISFLLALRFYIYHTNVLALPENFAMRSRHKKH